MIDIRSLVFYSFFPTHKLVPIQGYSQCVSMGQIPVPDNKRELYRPELYQTKSIKNGTSLYKLFSGIYQYRRSDLTFVKAKWRDQPAIDA